MSQHVVQSNSYSTISIVQDPFGAVSTKGIWIGVSRQYRFHGGTTQSVYGVRLSKQLEWVW